MNRFNRDEYCLLKWIMQGRGNRIVHCEFCIEVLPSLEYDTCQQHNRNKILATVH